MPVFRIVSPKEIEEQERKRSSATRGPSSKTRCEMPEDHDHYPWGQFHGGRSPSGRWFFWDLKSSESSAKLES